jgi:hypothetical protein
MWHRFSEWRELRRQDFRASAGFSHLQRCCQTSSRPETNRIGATALPLILAS